MVDATDSKSVSPKGVRVRVPSQAPKTNIIYLNISERERKPLVFSLFVLATPTDRSVSFFPNPFFYDIIFLNTKGDGYHEI